MSPDDFQAALDTGEPIRIYLADGREHDILNPTTAHIGESSVVVGVYGENQRFPRWTMIALKNIVTIQPLTAAELP